MIFVKSCAAQLVSCFFLLFFSMKKTRKKTVKDKKHLTQQGLDQIRIIKAGMNKARSA